jgi:hypothetical protein
MRRRTGIVLLSVGVSLATALTLVGGAAAAPVSDTIAARAAVPAAAVAARSPGQPPLNQPIRPGNYFSYLQSSGASQVAIRNRVLNTVKSTWGRYTVSEPNPATPDPSDTRLVSRRGVIRMATWSFGDKGMTDALIAARRRGAVVQVLAAAGINNDGDHSDWPRLRRALNGKGNYSWARQCRGTCRGGGGAAHAKYFLFQDVGSQHLRTVTVQTSMNLTSFAWHGQWNQATVMYSPTVFQHFQTIFAQASTDGRSGRGYRSYTAGNVTDIFFPMGLKSRDPIARALDAVRCKTPTAGGINGRTRVRAINYAIFESRGVLLAKKFRKLWNAGCDVKIIYSVTSRPVLQILRSRSGRGPVPMRQTVIKDRSGDIVKYNHSKWLAISGYYAGVSRGTYTVISGSANWSNLSYGSDEQMQQIFSQAYTAPYFTAFNRTWSQGVSRPPPGGRVAPGARASAPLARELAAIPREPTFGKGIYKYLTPEGD